MLTVVIPSNNEENYIEQCLDCIAAQTGLTDDHGIQVIVAANGCHDRTVQRAKAKEPDLAASGYALVVLDVPVGNKMNALNLAEEVATFQNRVFLDADVKIGPRMLMELAEVLSQDRPIYASGTLTIPRTNSIASRAYAKVWSNLPFVKDGVPGIGLYAMNGPGRARWEEFPPIYSDDRFVRLQFSSEERCKTKETYEWPLPDGFMNLVNVRHRWSEGNMELTEKYPQIIQNDTERNNTAASMVGLLRTPFSSVIFVLIYTISTLRARQTKGGKEFHWRRGRD